MRSLMRSSKWVARSSRSERLMKGELIQKGLRFHDVARLCARQTNVRHSKVPTMLLWRTRRPSTDQRTLEVMLRYTSLRPRQIRQVDQPHCK